MDIALSDIKYKQSKEKIDELNKNLKNIYIYLKNRDNYYLNELLDLYDNYFKDNEKIKKKKIGALEDILEYLEKINMQDKSDIKKIYQEIKNIDNK